MNYNHVFLNFGICVFFHDIKEKNKKNKLIFPFGRLTELVARKNNCIQSLQHHMIICPTKNIIIKEEKEKETNNKHYVS